MREGGHDIKEANKNLQYVLFTDSTVLTLGREAV